MPKATQTLKTALALTALIFTGSTWPALAADWGYDDQPDMQAPSAAGDSPAAMPGGKNVHPKGAAPKSARKGRKSAGPAGQSVKRAKASNQSLSNPPQPTTDETSLTQPPVKPIANTPSPDEIAARKKVEDLKSWMEIFALAASSASEDDRNQIIKLGTLAEETRKKLEKMIFEKLEQNVPEYIGISSAWRPLRPKVTEDIDYKESYRLLFRSLLHHAVGRIEPTAPQAEAIQEVLGPARIAEMGPPVLTEDAINAYSDMTCFLYQKRNPDHTVEGDDNRMLFAEVIRQRYNDAPNLEAKKAMCNFDITWASFRCRYLDSNAAEKTS